MGGYCGYLATIAALSSGADNAYIFEEPFSVRDIADDVEVISQKMDKGVQRYLVIRNEQANENYTTEFIAKLFNEEAKGKFSTRVNVLGHMQQGGVASPFDRNQATKLACRAAEHVITKCRQSVQKDGSVYTDDLESASVLGILDRQIQFTPVQQLAPSVDFKHRLPRNQWWLKVRPLLRILSKHMDHSYESEGVVAHDPTYDPEL